jgi:phage terminase small subunit
MSATKSHETGRLKPRSGLPPEIKLLWIELVGSMPSDHFRSSDSILIEQYCQAAALARTAYANLDAEGAVVAGRANPFLVVLEKAHRSSVALSMRLRLSPQSRIRRETVGSAKQTPASYYDLMEMAGDD